jgi:hypothetical protein
VGIPKAVNQMIEHGLHGKFGGLLEIRRRRHRDEEFAGLQPRPVSSRVLLKT